jgi:hypothetical protein
LKRLSHPRTPQPFQPFPTFSNLSLPFNLYNLFQDSKFVPLPPRVGLPELLSRWRRDAGVLETPVRPPAGCTRRGVAAAAAAYAAAEEAAAGRERGPPDPLRGQPSPPRREQASSSAGARPAGGGGPGGQQASGAVAAVHARHRASAHLPAHRAHRPRGAVLAHLPGARLVPARKDGARECGHCLHQVGAVGVDAAGRLPRAAVRRPLRAPLAGTEARLVPHATRGGDGDGQAGAGRLRVVRRGAVRLGLDRADAPRDGCARPAARRQGAPPERRRSDTDRLCADAHARGLQRAGARAALAQPEGVRLAVLLDDGRTDSPRYRGRAPAPLRVELRHEWLAGRPLPTRARRRRAARLPHAARTPHAACCAPSAKRPAPSAKRQVPHAKCRTPRAARRRCASPQLPWRPRAPPWRPTLAPHPTPRHCRPTSSPRTAPLEPAPLARSTGVRQSRRAPRELRARRARVDLHHRQDRGGRQRRRHAATARGALRGDARRGPVPQDAARGQPDARRPPPRQHPPPRAAACRPHARPHRRWHGAHRTAPHRTAPHRTAPHRTAPP